VTRTLESVPSYSDYFCGYGGSSQGARKLGLNIRMAANHWDLAVATHSLNFPDSDHDQADISGTDPRRHPTTTIAWFSPECTNHSMAKGKKRQSLTTQLDLLDQDVKPLPDAAAERSRATMWDVPRFAEYHRYRYVIVENVVDARYWIGWHAWLQAMTAMEYEHEVVYLNSMHAGSDVAAPAPQSRDRMYVVFWQRGERKPNLAITPPAWCGRCDKQVMAVQAFKKAERWGRYRAQYLYRCPSCMTVVEPYTLPAASAIDWTVPGQRIGDRAKPLAPKTIARIKAGIERYGRPFHLEAAGNQYDAADPKHKQHGQPTAYIRVWPADTEPLRTLHTIESKALLVPVEGRDGKAARGAAEVLRTMTTRNETGLAVPPMLVPAGGTWNDRATAVTEVMRTRTTRDTEALLVPPFIAELRGGGSKHRPVTAPLATVTASGTHHGLVQPPEVAALVMRNNSSKGDGAEMSTPTTQPLRTLTTTGHQSLITWQALYGYDGGALRPLGIPMPTQTTVQGDGLLSGGSVPDVDECLFRMLEPSEIGLGMAFEPDYQVLGNKREQVRGYGNAVTPCAGSLLLGRVVTALTGEVA
jgi:DNA (cytosine-5)-methyltransferase 1